MRTKKTTSTTESELGQADAVKREPDQLSGRREGIRWRRVPSSHAPIWRNEFWWTVEVAEGDLREVLAESGVWLDPAELRSRAIHEVMGGERCVPLSWRLYNPEHRRMWLQDGTPRGMELAAAAAGIFSTFKGKRELQGRIALLRGWREEMQKLAALRGE